MDELAFLFVVQPDTNDDGAVRVLLVDADFLGLFRRLEGRSLLRVSHTRHTELS